jgi:hypothetical protein
MYKFNYLANQAGYDVDGNVIENNADKEIDPTQINGLHPSWDVDNNGLNDCENDGSCDHTVDYTKPRILENK